jgi:hypothetical protein
MPSLQIKQPPTPLSASLFSPVFSAGLHGLIHLFGAGETPNTGRHLLLDPDGKVIGTPWVMPNTLIEGMAAADQGFFILNGQVAADRYKAQFYQLDGSLTWDCPVPVSRSLARFVQPAVMNHLPVIVWATMAGNTTRVPGAVRESANLASLSLALMGPTGSEPVRSYPLKGSVTALSLAPTPNGLLAVCDPRGRLELIYLTAKGVTWQLQVEGVLNPVSPSVAVCADKICLAWIVQEALFVQWFDLTGLALSAPLQLAGASERTRLLSTSMFSDGLGRLAIAYLQETITDDWNMLESEFGRQHRFLPKLAYQEQLALLAPGCGLSGSWLQITPPGLPYHCGCWQQDNLYLLHGDQTLLFSRLIPD